MRTLRKTINRYLIILAAVSIAVMLIIVAYAQFMAERKYAYESAVKTFSQIGQVLEENRGELVSIKAEYRQTCLNNARTISRIIEGDPDVIYDVDELKELAEITGVDEIHIFDETGRIFAGTHPEYYDYTFDSGEQMNFFKPMLTDKTLGLVQDITPNTAEEKLMQYSALWSRRGDIIVQVGMEPRSVMKVTEKNETSYIFSLFRVAPETDYYAIDAECGEIVGATVPEDVGKSPEDIGLSLGKIAAQGRGFFANVNGRSAYCVFQLADGNYLGRVVSNSELFHQFPATVILLTICLAVIVVILCCATSFCMNKYVVEKLRAVNGKLNSITLGNHDEQIDIQGSLEFSELSSYLNSMVKSLLDDNRKMSYVLSRTNMYIGVYEYNDHMKKIRYTEYLPGLLGLDEAEMERLASDYGVFRTFLDQLREAVVPDEPGVFRQSAGRYVRLEEISEDGQVLGVVIDVTDDIQRRRKIELERDADALTGLYNRRGLDFKLEALFRQPEELGHSAFVMVDADGLKAVNDTYGHEMGDIYLRKTAELIRDFEPEHSVTARQGGDEFVLFLYRYEDEASLSRALEALEGMQDHVTVYLDGTLRVPIRFSLGYCLTRGERDYREVLKEADRLMYENKRARKEAGICTRG